ncbi:MAG: hypothetical protein WA254_17075 [Candidatus Sulfotelmatobacter sp.]
MRESQSKKGVNARQYMCAVAPPQSGKDHAIDAALDVWTAAPQEFDQFGEHNQTFLTNGKPDSQHIGAKVCNCASENAVIDHAAVWPVLLNKPPEFGAVIDKSGIHGNMALLEFMLGAWDSTFPVLSTAKNRKEVPHRVLFSLLTSIQPERLSSMQVSSGLYSRIVWVTVPKFQVASYLQEPVYGDLQQRLFAKVMGLEKLPLKIPTSHDAKVILRFWFEDLALRNYEDDQIRTRMNIITLRNALHLAWMLGEKEISVGTMEKALRISDWQLSVRANLFLQETDNDVARHQVRIKKSLRKGALTGRALRKVTSRRKVVLNVLPPALD